MALNQCVRTILCGLSQPLRLAIKSALLPLRAELQANLVILQAKSASLQLAAAAANIAFKTATGVIGQAQAAANLLPFSVVADCSDLGDISLTIRKNIDFALQDLSAVQQDLTRILSLQDEINFLIDQANANLALIDEVVNVIGTC